MSYGVPVVISGTVGAKDILVDGAGIVVDNLTPDRLCDTLINLTTADLKKMNEIYSSKTAIMQIEAMSKQIETDCYRMEFITSIKKTRNRKCNMNTQWLFYIMRI